MATVGRHTTRRKNKLLKYLPKAASAVTFQNPIFSPGRDKQRHQYSSSGFSGPIVSIIPDEARRRPRSGASRADHDDATTQEPSSPKVSCIGQIKLHKDKKKKDKMIVSNKAQDKLQHSGSYSHHRHGHHHRDEKKRDDGDAKAKKKDSKILKMFRIGAKSKKCKPAGDDGGSTKSDAAPSLGQMKRYTSGRQSMANFDWSAQIAPVSDLDDRNCHSDEEFGRYSDGEEEAEEEVIIPFSAPIVMGMMEPRREVNLWQRRNTSSPPPIKVRYD